MIINRSETILGEANFKKVTGTLKGFDSECMDINPFDSIVRDYLYMLDAGHNEQDCVALLVERASQMTGQVYKDLLGAASLKPTSKPIAVKD